MKTKILMLSILLITISCKKITRINEDECLQFYQSKERIGFLEGMEFVVKNNNDPKIINKKAIQVKKEIDSIHAIIRKLPY